MILNFGVAFKRKALLKVKKRGKQKQSEGNKHRLLNDKETNKKKSDFLGKKIVCHVWRLRGLNWAIAQANWSGIDVSPGWELRKV